MRRRLDAEMVRRGIAGSRTEAALAIRSGKVTVAGRPAAKAATLVEEFEPIHLASPARRFVSRGGEKLAAALDRFDLDVTGQQCLDAGASTGGFTDCLLSRGARDRRRRRIRPARLALTRGPEGHGPGANECP